MNKRANTAFAALSLALAGWGIAPAQAQIAATATGTGSFNGALTNITDNIIPGEGTQWNAPDKVSWTGFTQVFTVDLGGIFTVQDLVVSLDNNDTYAFEYSTNNLTFTPLITVLSTQGEIGGGMDTFSTVAGDAEYVAALDFAPVQAQYIRSFATGGDTFNSIGEIQTFGVSTTAAAPEPGTVVFLAAGLLPLVGLLARRRQPRK